MGSKRRAQRAGFASVAEFLVAPPGSLAFGEIEVPEIRGGGVLPAFYLKFPKGKAAAFEARKENAFRLKCGLKEVGPVTILVMTCRVSTYPRTFTTSVNHHGEGPLCQPFDRMADAGRYAVVALEDSPKPIWVYDFPTNRASHVAMARKLAALPPWTQAEYEAAVASVREEDVVREMWS